MKANACNSFSSGFVADAVEFFSGHFALNEHVTGGFSFLSIFLAKYFRELRKENE